MPTADAPGAAHHPAGLARIAVTRQDDGTLFEVRQRRFEPAWRWLVLTAATATFGAVLAWAVARGLPSGTGWQIGTVLAGIALFTGVLASVAGALTALPATLVLRSRVAFEVHPLGIAVTRPPRRRTPRAMHVDELVGPFVRIDEAIDVEASAATMMRAGGEEMATALATGARATGGSADTLTWFLFSGSAGSVGVVWRGFTVVLAEGLSRTEAEELAHAVEAARR